MKQDFSKNFQSDYNVAMGSMIRLQEALLSINDCYRTKNYEGYYYNLNVLFYEVSPYLNEKEFEGIMKLKKETFAELNNCYNASTKNINASFKLYDFMEEYNLILRRLLLKNGLYTKVSQKLLTAQRG